MPANHLFVLERHEQAEAQDFFAEIPFVQFRSRESLRKDVASSDNVNLGGNNSKADRLIPDLALQPERERSPRQCRRGRTPASAVRKWGTIRLRLRQSPPSPCDRKVSPGHSVPRLPRVRAGRDPPTQRCKAVPGRHFPGRFLPPIRGGRRHQPFLRRARSRQATPIFP